jgi:hypothetical protein
VRPAALSNNSTVAAVLAKDLAALGARRCFGLLGTANFKISHGLVEAGIEFISARHEGNAASMADAYRVTIFRRVYWRLGRDTSESRRRDRDHHAAAGRVMMAVVLLVIPGRAERANPESRAATSRFRIGPRCGPSGMTEE